MRSSKGMNRPSGASAAALKFCRCTCHLGNGVGVDFGASQCFPMDLDAAAAAVARCVHSLKLCNEPKQCFPSWLLYTHSVGSLSNRLKGQVEKVLYLSLNFILNNMSYPLLLTLKYFLWLIRFSLVEYPLCCSIPPCARERRTKATSQSRP